MPEDLRKLGFISGDAPDSSVIAEPLGRILTQLSAGGGAKGVNIEQVRTIDQAAAMWWGGNEGGNDLRITQSHAHADVDLGTAKHDVQAPGDSMFGEAS